VPSAPEPTATRSNAVPTTAGIAGRDNSTGKKASESAVDIIVSSVDDHEAVMAKDIATTKVVPPTQDASSAIARSDPGVLGSAYHKAWQSLDEEERKDLTVGDGMRQLLLQLNDADEKDQKESLLRRGIQAVSPFLGPVKLTLDFVGTFAEAEPIAGTAIGIIKGVTSVRAILRERNAWCAAWCLIRCGQVGIAISSAAQDLDLTLLIGSVLELLPVMDRCDQIVWNGKVMTDLHNVRSAQ
jgi:hypothetical protein